MNSYTLDSKFFLSIQVSAEYKQSRKSSSSQDIITNGIRWTSLVFRYRYIELRGLRTVTKSHSDTQLLVLPFLRHMIMSNIPHSMSPTLTLPPFQFISPTMKMFSSSDLSKRNWGRAAPCRIIIIIINAIKYAHTQFTVCRPSYAGAPSSSATHKVKKFKFKIFGPLHSVQCVLTINSRSPKRNLINSSFPYSTSYCWLYWTMSTSNDIQLISFLEMSF